MGLQEGPRWTSLSGDSSGLGLARPFLTSCTYVTLCKSTCSEQPGEAPRASTAVPSPRGVRTLPSVNTAPLAMGTLPCPCHVVLVILPGSVNTLSPGTHVCAHTQSMGQSEPLAGKQMTACGLVHE